MKEVWQYRASVNNQGDWTDWTNIVDGSSLHFSSIKVPFIWEFRKVMVPQTEMYDNMSDVMPKEGS